MASYGFRADLFINSAALSQFLRESEDITQDAIEDAFTKVQNKIRKVYKANTEGRERISKFLATSKRPLRKPSKGVALEISVDSRNAKGRAKLDRNPIGRSKFDSWNSIIVQEEFGDLKSGQFGISELRLSGKGAGRITSRNNLMAIATEPSRLGLSPRAFNGRWIPTDDPETALFIANEPGSRTIRAKPKSSRMRARRERSLSANRGRSRRSERAQRVARFRRARTTSGGTQLFQNDVLFVGKRSVPIRDAQPFIAPTIKTMRKEFPRIMESELGAKLPLTARRRPFSRT